MTTDAILRQLLEADDEESAKDILGDAAFGEPSWEGQPGGVILYDQYGNKVAYSRNLRGLRQWVRQYPVISVEIREKPDRGGAMLVRFYHGQYCVSHWADFGVLKHSLRNWRNLEGASLTVNGQDAGKISYRNPALSEAMEDDEGGTLEDLLGGWGVEPALQGDRIWRRVSDSNWEFQVNPHQKFVLINWGANWGDKPWEFRTLFDEMTLNIIHGDEQEMLSLLDKEGLLPGGGLHTREMKHKGFMEAVEDDDFKDLEADPHQEHTLAEIKAIEPGFFDRATNKRFGTVKAYKYPGNFVVVKNTKEYRPAAAFGHGGMSTSFSIYQLVKSADNLKGVLLYKGSADDLADAKAMIKTRDFRSRLDRARDFVNEAMEDDPAAMDIPIESIHIVGRNWWRRGYGGNYFRADIYVNDEKVTTTPEQGGSENQYLYDAFDWLERNGYITRIRRQGKFGGSVEGPQQVAERMGFKLTYEAYPVRRERDL